MRQTATMGAARSPAAISHKRYNALAALFGGIPKLGLVGLYLKDGDGNVADSIGESGRENELRKSIYFDGVSDYAETPFTGADIDELRGVVRVSSMPTSGKVLLGSVESTQRLYLSINSGVLYGAFGESATAVAISGAVIDTDLEISLKDNGDSTVTLSLNGSSNTDAFTGSYQNSQKIYIGGINSTGSLLANHPNYWHSLEFYKSGVLLAAYSHASENDKLIDRSGNFNHATLISGTKTDSIVFGSNTLELDGYTHQAVLGGAI